MICLTGTIVAGRDVMGASGMAAVADVLVLRDHRVMTIKMFCCTVPAKIHSATLERAQLSIFSQSTQIT